MKFKKVNENKIVVVLSDADLESRSINIDNIRDNSVAYQKLFWDMMEKAQAEIGFDVTGSQLMVETSPDKNGNIVITITKSGAGGAIGVTGSNKPLNAANIMMERIISDLFGSLHEDIQSISSGNDLNALGLGMGVPLGPGIHETEFTHETICFCDIDNVIDFCKSLNSFEGLSSSLLYDFDAKYYIVIKRTKTNGIVISNLLEAALEFNGEVSESHLLIALLEERGNKLIKSKASKTLAGI